MNRYRKQLVMTNNKMDGFGDNEGYDGSGKPIRINKKLHEQGKKKSLFGISKKDSTIQNTVLHEKLHRLHPQMQESSIRKLTRKQLEKMSQKQKARLHNKYV